jgi:hypothetical protein
VSTQTPQSTQLSGFTFALSFAMLIALLGHSCTQDSQPVHFFTSTWAGIQLSFQKKRFTLSCKTRNHTDWFGEYNPKLHNPRRQYTRIDPERPALMTKFLSGRRRPTPEASSPAVHHLRSVPDEPIRLSPDKSNPATSTSGAQQKFPAPAPVAPAAP